MDELKRRTIKDYTGWDINCQYNSRNWDDRNTKLKNIFRRKARRKLKQELNKESE